MRKNGEGNNRRSVSEKKLPKLDDQVTSEDLPKHVCMQLYGLMNRVVKDDVNPKTVSAACSCASEIHKILKLNHEISRGRR